eukprot:jgi/Mesvir1/18261/Mv09531-RA.1
MSWHHQPLKQGGAVALGLAVAWLFAATMRYLELRVVRRELRANARRDKNSSHSPDSPSFNKPTTGSKQGSGPVTRRNVPTAHSSDESNVATRAHGEDLSSQGLSNGAAPKASQHKSVAGNGKGSQEMRPPPVSMVLPVKGTHANSRSNWATQLALSYRGRREYIFVVESRRDAAHAALEDFLSLYPKTADFTWKLLEAGLATSSSQKLHNMVTGFEASAADSEFILFLDDDIRLHPGSVDVLVDGLTKHPQCFLATGYPFDIPSASFGSYCFMANHLPLIVPFSTGRPTSFVWGGCMMLRSKDLRADLYGCISAWRQGFSDDLIMASIAGANQRAVLCHSRSLFQNWLSDECSMRRYWNYLCRQVYVLYTWCSFHNRCVNTALLLSHSYLSWALSLPVLPGTLRLLAVFTALLAHAMRLAMVTATSLARAVLRALPDIESRLAPLQVPKLRLFRRLVEERLREWSAGGGSESGGMFGHAGASFSDTGSSLAGASWRDAFGGAALGGGWRGNADGSGEGACWDDPWSHLPWWNGVRVGLFYWVSLAIALAATRCMIHAMSSLTNALSPDLPPVVVRRRFSWVKTWLGLMVHNALYPVSAIVTGINPAVEWSGTRYVRKKGVVCQVLHEQVHVDRPV